MKHVQLSVIVPIYNVEHTLVSCIESVLNQNMEGMELILVDDGSTDSSPAIADGYSNRPGITVIHKVNGGLSDARNEGLRHAKGRYVTFVDSDDILMSNTYASVMEILSGHPEYDIVEYSFVRHTPHGLLVTQLPDREYHDLATYWLEGHGYAHAYAWNKIYRRQLFENVEFEKGRLFEDVHAMADLLPKVTTLRTTGCGTYHYNYNPTGITANADARALRDLLSGHLRFLQRSDLVRCPGFPDYYAQLLNIQLSTFDCSADVGDIRLPQMPFRNTWKLRLLQLMGMKRLCQWHRRAKVLLHTVSNAIPKP